MNYDIDELTTLYTKKSFFKIAQKMMQEAPEDDYNIIISDIDSFKMINARYGEDKGDELLAFVGKSLQVLNCPTICFGRYSGDQFVGFFRVDKSIENPDFSPLFTGMEMMYKNAPVAHYEVKFGIYENVDKTLSISAMCDRAIIALRTIKHQYGKMLAKYTQDMNLQYMKEKEIEDTMESSLNENQFKVYYQPKHDCKTGKLVGAEALTRWIHPNYGFMSPAEFIPIFERNGFISKLDCFVWYSVYHKQKEWVNKGYQVVPVSINISYKDLIHENILKEMYNVLSKKDIDPSLFHMEITESTFIDDLEYVKPIVQTIRDNGIQIELDDFGSGYSALSLLTSFPLDFIKLDMSFVKNLDKQKIIVKSIIKICHDLQCQMVAEGVETKEQLDTLKEMGCDIIQGYYYSKPLSEEEFEQYLKEHS